MSGQSKSGLQFHTKVSGSAAPLVRCKRPPTILCLCIVLLSVMALLLLPGFRESGKALCNALFEASEAVNAYEYRHFSVADGTTFISALVLTAIAVIGLYLLALVRSSRILTLLLAVGFTGVQAYFGVVFPWWGNVLVFMLLGAVLLRAGHSLLPYMAGVLTISLMVNVLVPGIHIPTENASEAVRDRLSIVGQELTEELIQSLPETQKTQHENRLDIEGGMETGDGMSNDREYRYEQELEQEISKPNRSNYFKIAVIFLLIVALLLGPFLPFILLDSRRKKALARREKFDSENLSEAIRAMFLHLIAWLESCGQSAGNLPFSAWTSHLQMPEAYLTQYKRAAALWQEAAYSDHTMTSAQRDEMRQILNETECILYDAADWKTRFRLNYMECLREEKESV